MISPALVYRLLLTTSLLVLVAIVALVAVIVPSADNGPFMTPLAILVVAFLTTLILAGFVNGLRTREHTLSDDLIDQHPTDD